jgi:hypothetical protein
MAFQTGWGTNLTEIADTVSLGSPPVVPPLKVLGTGFNPNFFLGFQFGAGGGASFFPDLRSRVLCQRPEIHGYCLIFPGSPIHKPGSKSSLLIPLRVNFP